MKKRKSNKQRRYISASKRKYCNLSRCGIVRRTFHSKVHLKVQSSTSILLFTSISKKTFFLENYWQRWFLNEKVFKKMFNLFIIQMALLHIFQERRFLELQQENYEKSMKRLADQHKEKVALLEKQFLQQKHQLLRAREAAIWELEERQLHEKHKLAKRQLKDLFFLKRHQMLNRHEKVRYWFLQQTKQTPQRINIILPVSVYYCFESQSADAQSYYNYCSLKASIFLCMLLFWNSLTGT